MKPAPFSYVRPTSLGEALAALGADPHAKVLAGGQSLIPLLSMRLAAPSALVDINGLGELAYVRTDEKGVRIGALARHAEVERDPDARRVQPLLS
ncbi:MAG TPA: FAD binding domain-containing protein, partial [Nocardioidaceae bacterium]